jgi:hypothetical protein
MQGSVRGPYYRMLAVDALLNLAEALGVRPTLSIEHQGLEAFRRQLNVDVPLLFQEVEAVLQFDLGFPRLACAYGYRVGEKIASSDLFYHAYTVHRLRQLGGGVVAEIGGGYGCLGLLLARGGFARTTIFDLTWVGAIQAYFLLMTLPPSDVALYGENHSACVRISPHWEFHELAHRSVDLVVNANSLPEMAMTERIDYLRSIARVTRRAFFSINQESGIMVLNNDPQSPVGRLAAKVGGLHEMSRHRSWMRQGFVEEVFAPNS